MKSRNGFTLLELLLTLFIIALATSIGFTYFSSGKSYLKKDVRVLYNYLNLMRVKAINLKSRTYIEYNLSSNSYSLKYDNGTILKTISLSSKVEFGDGGHSSLSNHKAAFGSTNPPKTYFYPNGSCSPSGSVYLKEKHSNDSVYKIAVNLAGNISISKWNGSSFENNY